VPVTEFIFAATIGMEAPVPSFGARLTSKRLATADFEGIRNTSE
jgi:hypothetical protein